MRWMILLPIVLAACGANRGSNDGGGGGRDLAGGKTADFGAPIDLAQALPDLPNSNCLGGDYVGTYEGQILIGGLVPVKTKGSVELTLTQSGGEFFEIMNGHLMGEASGNPYSSDLEGTLNCATLKLDKGMIKNGKVTISNVAYMFEGPLTADYDPKTASFVNGVWDIKQVPPGSTGKGTWTAKHK
ncbi:MAG: hypothetical protein EXR72_11535 [Myxococcales bacterium]|nr:hypothetical protein [Myxococcales bacterium]